ncbi:MAG: methylated-DNA--[protein]-cysteine S-methyltransferase, partial [Chloroflexota bacterium]
RQPRLDEMAASVHLSPHHFHRLFKRWSGVTPHQFLQYLTVQYAKEQLRTSRSVLDVSYDSGLSSPSRLHDRFVSIEAMTPGEYKQQAAGIEIQYGFHPTPFGECLIAVTERGICAMRFPSPEQRTQSLESLRKEWPKAHFVESNSSTREIVRQIFADTGEMRKPKHRFFLKGTNFQIHVWQALLSIPSGRLVTYQDVATMASRPSAVRAAANAVARNPIAYLIPCHRVIRSTGHIHQYRWGSARKKTLLGWEASRSNSVTRAV